MRVFLWNAMRDGFKIGYGLIHLVRIECLFNLGSLLCKSF